MNAALYCDAFAVSLGPVLRLAVRHPDAVLCTYPAMQKRMVPTIPLFLRTHPLTEDRVIAVQRDMPEAMRLFVQAGKCCCLCRCARAWTHGWTDGCTGQAGMQVLDL